jgi:hypothetical protein
MIAFVRSNFCPNGKALHTKIEIGTFGTFDANDAGDIFVAVITVIQSSFSLLSSCNNWVNFRYFLVGKIERIIRDAMCQESQVAHLWFQCLYFLQLK